MGHKFGPSAQMLFPAEPPTIVDHPENSPPCYVHVYPNDELVMLQGVIPIPLDWKYVKTFEF